MERFSDSVKTGSASEFHGQMQPVWNRIMAISLYEHGPFGKPASAFPDRATPET
jgi:hypothetical protein